MPKLRERWRITLDGLDPFEIETTGWDNVGISIAVQDGVGEIRFESQFQVVHNACMREEIAGVPRSFREFMLRLIEADQVEAVDASELDPTQSDRSAVSP